MNDNIITSTLVAEHERMNHVGRLFGARYLWIESFIFDTAGSLSEDYDGGVWDFRSLSNGGFYMVPGSPTRFNVICDNGFEGELSSEAFGITCGLYAYSQLSFSPDPRFGELCADHFHLLRAFMLEHAEAKHILAAID
jgi:hypothetical protein